MAPDFFHSHSSSIRSDHNRDMDKSSHDKSSWKKADQSSFCMCHAANPEAFMIHDPGPDAHDCLWPSPQTLELLPRSSMCYMWWNICCSSSHVHPAVHYLRWAWYNGHVTCLWIVVFLCTFNVSYTTTLPVTFFPTLLNVFAFKSSMNSWHTLYWWAFDLFPIIGELFSGELQSGELLSGELFIYPHHSHRVDYSCS